jgi:hypothetical protein
MDSPIAVPYRRKSNDFAGQQHKKYHQYRRQTTMVTTPSRKRELYNHKAAVIDVAASALSQLSAKE